MLDHIVPLNSHDTPAVPPVDFRNPTECATVLDCITRYSVPVIEFHDDTPVKIATGTIFSLGELSFLVTAEHVLKTLGSDTPGAPVLGIPDASGRPQVLRLRGRGVPHVDVAVLEILHGDLQRLGGRYAALSLREVFDFSGRTPLANDYLVCGYPAVRQLVGEEGGDLKALALRTHAYDGPPPESLGIEWMRPFRRELEFLATLTESGQTPDGQKVEVPALDGMSGGVLWCMTPGTGPQALRALAVQSSTVEGAFIRFTPWAIVASVIAHHWPELRELLEAHFEAMRPQDPPTPPS